MKWIEEKQHNKQKEKEDNERAMAEFLSSGGKIVAAGTTEQLKEFNSKHWQKLRKEFLEENTHIIECEDCGKPLPPWIDGAPYSKNSKGRSVDHIIAKGRDFSKAHDKKNLRVICNRCNMEKGTKVISNRLRQNQEEKENKLYRSLGEEVTKKYEDEWREGGRYLRERMGMRYITYVLKRIAGEIKSCLDGYDICEDCNKEMVPEKFGGHFCLEGSRRRKNNMENE